MIRSIHLVPVSEKSHPFGTALFAVPLSDSGYVEEEYFFDGTANVYERAENGGKRIRFADAPYTSRLMIRRPADPAKFSGTIVFEINNSTPQYDLDRCWVLLRKQIMRDGDIYVGVLSKPNVIRRLMQLDAERYQSLKWPNPLPCDLPANQLGNISGHSSPESEDGLFWDILMDTARLLKSADSRNPLSAFCQKPIKTILSGWSQSGGYMIRYIKDFSLEEGKDLFDGFLAMGAAPICTPNLNQSDKTPLTALDLHPSCVDKPMIDIHTESDNARLGGALSRMENGPLYRMYDIAGPSHDTVYSSIEYQEGNTDFDRLGIRSRYQGAEPNPNAFPQHLAFHSALAWLKTWIWEGKAPQILPPIPFDQNLHNQKKDGNSVGGYQLPQFALPVCEYHGTATPPSPEAAFSCSVFGCERPFAKGELQKRYGSLAEYESRLTAETDQAIQKGLLQAADRDEAIERAMKQAVKYGLM
ncbi:MAG: hypothetical protein J6P72_01385 [Firmicutes bacterium]|nr:hypothetical protein [Bacillota bacterium]